MLQLSVHLHQARGASMHCLFAYNRSRLRHTGYVNSFWWWVILHGSSLSRPELFRCFLFSCIITSSQRAVQVSTPPERRLVTLQVLKVHCATFLRACKLANTTFRCALKPYLLKLERILTLYHCKSYTVHLQTFTEQKSYKQLFISSSVFDAVILTVQETGLFWLLSHSVRPGILYSFYSEELSIVYRPILFWKEETYRKTSTKLIYLKKNVYWHQKQFKSQQ